MRVVQVGTNRANDDLSRYLLSNYDKLEFGLFVEPFQLHNEKIKECYSKYDNIIIENLAIRTPLQEDKDLTIYYHTNEHPNYEIATCDLSHLEKHMEWCPHLQGGEVRSFTAKSLTLEDLFTKYDIYYLDLLCLDVEGIDAEILLTFDWKKYKIKKIEFEHLHLGYYKDAVKNMMIGLGYEQVESLHEYDWAFINPNIVDDKDKLNNFPSINIISIVGSEERRQVLYNMFENYSIDNYSLHLFNRYVDEDHNIVSNDADIYVDKTYRGPLTSHLQAIKRWYETTDEEYAIFFEDDVSFDAVKYWNFTWNEFFDSLPTNWECVQLCAIATHKNVMEQILGRNRISRRDWSDWSCAAYLIKRSHAKKLIDAYLPEETFYLDYKGWDRELRNKYHYCFIVPTPENIVYTLFEDTKDSQSVYLFPLFLENISFSSTWCESDTHSDDENSLHNFSRKFAEDWWKSKGVKLSIEDVKYKD